jgi:hypothetical protein
MAQHNKVSLKVITSAVIGNFISAPPVLNVRITRPTIAAAIAASF